MMPKIAVGLDIGGTKLMAVAQRGGSRQTVTRPTPARLDEGLEAIDAMIEELLEGKRPSAIGVAIGGPLDFRTGVVSPLHQLEWRDVPLKRILERRWGCPCRIEVDTDAAALGEARFGQANESPLLYLTISTGVGAGLLVGGEIYRGTGGSHPEAGHMVVDESGLECECGARGCLESLVSGNGIRRRFGCPPEELSDDQWQVVASDLGRALRNLASLYAPEAIVFGGGIAFARGERLLAPARQTMREGLRLVPHPAVRLSSLGYDTALMGALALALEVRR